MNKPKSLRELVEVAITRHDTSGRQLAFLAQREGFTLATTTVNAIRQGTYKSTPTNETIKAIAWLAGVSDEAAFTAAGQPVPGPPFADELPPGVDNLPAKARKAAIDMLRVLVDMNKDDDALQPERDDIREERNRIVHDYADAMRTSRERGKRRNAVPGQKTSEDASAENVTPLDDDAIDRLHQAEHYDLAAKPAHGGIAHDQDAEDA
ncbi:hypothetical protein [Pseudarthrobacter sp. NIBRBAC000502770]|uniref:hypothetical protein n=1 Tax=Pseudarthrobacter sp. NIBRBAC000502770 TaxID=2590785 RepID=UPI00113FD34D|nr:hypothetical protein [Pseudarthrobacter sp. NIBRBAC000502770]QDG88840.1 hypothetical protein NIBR502770_10420 [Pseudarthrobacter sp. NIBRBAC000502770]